MYALRNTVQLIGNVGSKPEIKTTEAGKKHTSFSIAINDSFENAKGEKVVETHWHRLVAWGKVAELVEKYLDKGSEVMIEGRLVSRTYNDKDGNKKFINEVDIREMMVIGLKAEKKDVVLNG
jgi:single-strand DNA-binding protein